jgi:hypothetical protein
VSVSCAEDTNMPKDGGRRHNIVAVEIGGLPERG